MEQASGLLISRLCVAQRDSRLPGTIGCLVLSECVEASRVVNTDLRLAHITQCTLAVDESELTCKNSRGS